MLADDINHDLTTRTGFRFHVRRALPQDEPKVAEFFKHVTAEDIRFRFLSGMKEVSHERLAAMTRSDDRQVSNFLAFAPNDTLLAVAMLASDDGLERGEVALSIREDYKRLGISWELLSHIANYARRHGFKSIESIESRENHAAIELEREMGFKVMSYPDDPNVVLLRQEFSGSVQQ
ncbi:MAG: GNAT family N-acetyltransferase [Phyllobacterium sp.]|uniref:GNAT family N-acetyltransferase n=1 Tax=Phyllobacterium sp. TaxID=1871046 RepID=UPI0030F27785